MDIDTMVKQIANLTRRVEVLEGTPAPEHMSPEGVVQEMETAQLTEDRVKELIAEHNQVARGAEPGGAATGDGGKTGASSQVQVGTMGQSGSVGTMGTAGMVGTVGQTGTAGTMGTVGALGSTMDTSPGRGRRP